MPATSRLRSRRSAVHAWLPALFVFVLLPGALALWVEAAPPSQSADAGKTLFQQKCASCHSAGTETLVGPGLQYETVARSRDWLSSWIAAPDKLVAQGDPLAVGLVKLYNGVQMPNLGLTDAQVADVIAYMATLPGAPAAGAAPAAVQAPAAAPLPPGNAAAGAALFSATVPLQNGGPPCMACHTIAGIGGLGGGAVGPDLTTAFTRYGAAGLPSVLANVTFPTMAPIFAGHALTPQETADLSAYLQQIAGTGQTAAPPATFGIISLAVLGVIALLALVQLTWRLRLTTVRQSLQERPN